QSARQSTSQVSTRTGDRRSLFHARTLRKKAEAFFLEGRSARTPPSTFLFLPIHLSNSPETLRFPTSRRTEKPTKFEPPTSSRRSCPHISEELQEARNRAVSGRRAE